MRLRLLSNMNTQRDAVTQIPTNTQHLAERHTQSRALGCVRTMNEAFAQPPGLPGIADESFRFEIPDSLLRHTQPALRQD